LQAERRRRSRRRCLVDAETVRWAFGGAIAGTWVLLGVISAAWWADSRRLWSALERRTALDHASEKEAWQTYATEREMRRLFAAHELRMEKLERNIEAKLTGMEGRIGDMIVYLRKGEHDAE
jgi:hypothetical protein